MTQRTTAGNVGVGLTSLTRRHVLSAAGITAVPSLALAACAAGGGPGPGGRTARPIDGTLVYWAEGGQSNASYQAWVARIADFRAANPQADVEMTETPDREAKLVTAVAAGTPPDVAVHNRYLTAAAHARGVLQGFEALAKSAGIKGDDQQPWCWAEVARDGKVWGLPYSTDTRMVYVNAGHLRRAGIPLTAPKTLDDFVGITRQLTVGQPGSFERLGYIPWANNWRLYGWGWLHGGEWYDPKANRATMDDPKNIAALEWEVARANELGGYDGVEAFRRSQPRSGLVDVFVAGALSATIGSTSQLVTMSAAKDLDWIVWAPPPPPGVNRQHTWSGGFANTIPTGVKNVEASFALARYLSDEEFQKVQNRTGSGRLPTLKSASKDPYWNTVDPRAKQFVDVLPFSHTPPPIVQVAILNRELDGAEGAEPLALKGVKRPAAALQEGNQRVNDAIKAGRFD